MKKRLFFLFASAVPYCGYSFTADPDSAAFYLKKALASVELKKAFDADKNFKKAIDFNKDDISTRFSYINFLLDEKKYFIALEQLEKLPAQDGMVLQKLIDVSFYLHRWKDVIAYEGLAATAKIKVSHYMLGKAYFEEEDYGLAEKALLLSVLQNPAHRESRILLGKVYLEMSDYKQAIVTYSVALDLDPDNSDLLYQLGLLYSTINNEKEAIRYIELSAEKGYKIDLDYKENLGMAYLSVDLQKGVDLLTKVLEKKPNNPEILGQIAEANYKAKNYKVAADIYFSIYEKDEANNKALYMMGKAYQKNGEKAYGMSLCEKAISQDPSLASLKLLKYAN